MWRMVCRAIVEELLQTRVALLADCPCHLQVALLPCVYLPAWMHVMHACPPVSFTLWLPIAHDLLMALMQEMEVGSCIGVCEVSSSPLSLWKGKTRVKLFVRYFSSAPTSRLSLTVSASLLLSLPLSYYKSPLSYCLFQTNLTLRKEKAALVTSENVWVAVVMMLAAS
jgi:hypothetical protein